MASDTYLCSLPRIFLIFAMSNWARLGNDFIRSYHCHEAVPMPVSPSSLYLETQVANLLR